VNINKSILGTLFAVLEVSLLATYRSSPAETRGGYLKTIIHIIVNRIYFVYTHNYNIILNKKLYIKYKNIYS